MGMLLATELTQPTVRAFVDALRERDNRVLADATSDDFMFITSDFDDDADLLMGNLSEFLHAEAVLAVTDQSADGLTLTGLTSWCLHFVGVRWTFEVEDEKVERLNIARVSLAEADRAQADAELRGLVEQARIETFETARDSNGRTHTRGKLRRTSMGHGHYKVSAWTVGALGGISWIITDERLSDPDVYRALRSPESGERTDSERYHKVESHLDLILGWDDDSYQKATVSFHATPLRWDAVMWLSENLHLVDAAVPVVWGTLTLTGPDGNVVSTEEVTAKGAKPPYPLSFTREFALADLPLGRYTITFTNAVKAGGYGAHGEDAASARINMADYTITFTVGA
ncbi:hypothetical protein [Actinokineospora enzanensis]|uniref:hypothetical protein n=1 Tax=Actinokineospora enzanensis TaxID=155975 RepID=UPI0012EBEC0A|nr:hypothetical protein [Actinokineospora enzanensis]